jgi:hypothetical protein
MLFPAWGGGLHMDILERWFLVAAGLLVLVGGMAWFELM